MVLASVAYNLPRPLTDKISQDLTERMVQQEARGARHDGECVPLVEAEPDARDARMPPAANPTVLHAVPSEGMRELSAVTRADSYDA